MIERLQELILANVFETLILLSVGFFVGNLFSYFFWVSKVRKRDGSLKELETAIEGKDTEIKKLLHGQELSTKQQSEIQNLNSQLKENKRERLKLSLQIKEKVSDLENNLMTQLKNKDQKLRNLNKQIKEKNQTIDHLEKKVADLEEVYQESVHLNKHMKNQCVELEKSVEEKLHEVSSIKGRMRYMQDDLTQIVGIGPKVSSILGSVGVNSFTKLSSIQLDRLKEILVAENPNLLRLTDPSRWPEQAKLASEEDWGALSSLQESIRSNRRS
jgi:predicted flap endonuclease-1-like 5' DNA nuclease